MVVTFYSFKGGVGRSMALANVAEILAAIGYHVIASDWDLEAPGLERSFTRTQAESDEMAAKPGLMDLLRAYKETLAGALTGPPNKDTQVKVGDVWLTRPSTYAITVSTTERGGSVRLLTAGARPANAYGKYADEVRGFDWKEFYEEWAGGAYIDFVRNDLSEGISTPDGPTLPPAADIVLVDSRTGVTEHGGVCTHHLADLVILMSAANDSNFYGSLRMAESLMAPGLKSLRSGRPMHLLPIRTRIEQTSQVVELNEFRARFTSQFTRYLPSGFQRTSDFFDEAEIPYIGLYSFGEVNLAREHTTRESKLYKAYHVLADAIIECGVDAGLLRDASVTTGVLRGVERKAVEHVRAIAGTFELLAAPDTAALATTLVSELNRLGASAVVARSDRRAEHGAPPGVNGSILLVGSNTPEPWVRAQFDELLRRRALSADFRVTPLLAPEVDLGAFPYLNRARVISLGNAEGSVRMLQLANELAGPAPAVALEPSTLCPYPGPSAFNESQARLFFGRDEDIRGILRQADPRRPLLIDGARGVGKSSLVHAGLLPAIRRGELFEPFFFGSIVQFAISENPITSLAAALIKAGPAQDAAALDAALRGDENTLAMYVRGTLARGQVCVLSVDRLERLWAPDVPGEDAQQILRLLEVALTGDPPIFFVATIASDALHNISHPFLEQLQKRAVRITLVPLKHEQLVTAITAPARLAGLTLDTRLPDRIAVDVQESGASTALMQASLRTLWQARTGGAPLTEALFQSVGGLTSMAIEVANTRMVGISESQRRRAQRLLARLALDQRAMGEGFPRAKTIKLAGGGKDGELLLEHLAHAPPLVEIQPSNNVTLAGRMLSEGWDALRRWMDEERDGRRRRVWQATGVAAAMVLIAVLGLFAGTRNAYARRDSEALALASIQEVAEDPLRGLALAIRAGDTAETETARTAIENALGKRYPRALLRHDAAIRSAAFSPDSAVVATADDAGTVLLWDATDGRARPSPAKHGGPVTAVRFSPDGTSIATASYDGSAAVWNAATGKPVWQIPSKPMQWVVTVEFSPDGREVIAGGSNGGVWIGTTATQRIEELKGHTAAITAATFSPNGRLILTTSVDGTARVWDATSHMPVATDTTLGPGAVFGAFAPDGRTAAIVGQGGSIVGVSPDGKAPVSLHMDTDRQIDDARRGQDRSESSVTFSPDGRLIATTRGESVRIWTSSDGALAVTVDPTIDSRATIGDALDVEFHPTDPLLVVARQEGTVFLWSLETNTRVAVLQAHTSAVRAAKFSPDGRSIVTASDDTTAALWNVSEDAVPRDSPFRYLLDRARSALPRNVTLAEISPSRQPR